MSQKYVLAIGVAILVGIVFTAPTWGAPCGGAVVCRCGDTVESDRNLTSADPVVQVVCPLNGLIMNTSGVVLNLRGLKIRGDGGASEAGILISPGVNNVQIRNGYISAFGTGIRTQETTNGSVIKEMDVKHCTVNGIDVAGDNNTFENNRQLAENGGDGMVVTGNDNIVTLNRGVLNAGDGIVVVGNNNDVSEKNQASKNKGNGITVQGDDNDIVSNNQIHHNDGHGIRVIGTGNLIQTNATTRNKLLGILVTGGGNIDGGGNNSNQGPQYLTSNDCQIDGNNCLP